MVSIMDKHLEDSLSQCKELTSKYSELTTKTYGTPKVWFPIGTVLDEKTRDAVVKIMGPDVEILFK